MTTTRLGEDQLAAGPGDVPPIPAELAKRIDALVAAVPLPTGDLLQRLVVFGEAHLSTSPELASILAFAANSIAHNVALQRDLDLAHRRRFGLPGTPKRLIAVIAGTVEA